MPRDFLRRLEKLERLQGLQFSPLVIECKRVEDEPPSEDWLQMVPQGGRVLSVVQRRYLRG